MSKRLHLYSYNKDYSIIFKRFTQWMPEIDIPVVRASKPDWRRALWRAFGVCKWQPITNLNPHLPLMAASSSFMMGFIWIFLDN